MTSDDGDSIYEARIRDWVESSGRGLELRTARAFRRATATVEPSRTYTDPLTGIQRESDLRASFNWEHHLSWDRAENVPCSLKIIVECKSNSDQPWIGFVDPAARPDMQQPSDWVAYNVTTDTRLANVHKYWMTDELFGPRPVATHIVSAQLGAKGDPKHNQANNAVRQALSASSAEQGEWLQKNPGPIGVFIIPVVITGARLFTCGLSPEDQLDLKEVQRVDVWGYDAEGKRRRVVVATEDRTEPLARAFAALAYSTAQATPFD